MIGWIEVFVQEIDGILDFSESGSDGLPKDRSLADSCFFLQRLGTGRDGAWKLDVEGFCFGGHVSCLVVFWLRS